MRHSLFVLTILILTSCETSLPSKTVLEPQTSVTKLIFPTMAKDKNVDGPEDDTLIARVNDIDFVITPTGQISWSNNPADTFQLLADLFIEKAFLHQSGDTLLVFYTDTDHEGANSWAEKIDMKARKSFWHTYIQGFNLGLPYILDNCAYVTTIGFIGKIDLADGRYIFETAGLYDSDQYSFNSFDSIIFRDSLTIFISENYRSKRIDSIILNEKTGRVETRK